MGSTHFFARNGSRLVVQLLVAIVIGSALAVGSVHAEVLLLVAALAIAAFVVELRGAIPEDPRASRNYRAARRLLALSSCSSAARSSRALVALDGRYVGAIAPPSRENPRPRSCRSPSIRALPASRA